ncbi:tyrosine-type recombinase/integrase [Lentisalinibacter orientalis]|uniref:tyrosine-type recombinase/integrase n=1 Tax=Lentisalinibacter orientalis TaxID=2992241 RepID=UPI003866CE82
MAGKAAKPFSAKGVEAKNKPGIYADGGGLYLQVKRSAAEAGDGRKMPPVVKSWLYRYKVPKASAKSGYKDVWVGLGPVRDVTLAKAREAAKELRQWKREGLDPLTELRRRRGRVAADNTFREIAVAYIESNRAGWTSDKHAKQWSNTLDTYAYPVIGDTDVQDVDTVSVLEVLRPIWSTKTETATRVRARIEAVLDYAAALELRDGENPARWQGKLKKLLPAASRVKRVRHHPAMPYAEVPAFMQALREVEGIAARALEFTVLTAARTSEVIGATWDEIDLKAKLWTVPAERMKAGKEHQVPLCDAAVAVLEGMKAHGDTGYLFKGRDPDKPLSNMTMTKVLRRMGRDDVTVHGFRSSFRDWCAEATDYPHAVAEQALAHTIPNATEQAYRRGQLLKKRTLLMTDWCNYTSKPATAKVTRLRSKAK